MKFIQNHTDEFSIRGMCRILEIKPGRYYAWLKRPLSNRTRENLNLIASIREINQDKETKTYGSPRIQELLKAKGHKVSRKRIAGLMKQNGIKAVNAKKYKPQGSTTSDNLASSNLLEQNFTMLKPNQAWVTDITYIPTRSGWVYLCTFMDLYSRKIIGWAVDSKPRSELVIKALVMAVRQRKPGSGLIIHSDRGTQYSSHDYRNKLKSYGFIQSMSRRGNCWDNACMESFYHSFKYEYLYQFTMNDCEDVYWLCFKYIEAFYNTRRLHSYLGYLSPAVFEDKKIA